MGNSGAVQESRTEMGIITIELLHYYYIKLPSHEDSPKKFCNKSQFCRTHIIEYEIIVVNFYNDDARM